MVDLLFGCKNTKYLAFNCYDTCEKLFLLTITMTIDYNYDNDNNYDNDYDNDHDKYCVPKILRPYNSEFFLHLRFRLRIFEKYVPLLPDVLISSFTKNSGIILEISM